MQRVVLNVFIPKERALIGWFGPWAEEWKWKESDLFTWQPLNLQSDDQSERWVSEGIALSASPPFQRDGTMFSFSALKPAAPPLGSLRLMTLSKTFLSSAVLFLLAAIAFALLRSPLKWKVVAIAGVCLVMVVIGVFAPTLAAHMFSLPIFAGLATAIVLWCGWYGFQTARRFEGRSQPVFQPVAAEPASVSTATTNAADDKSSDEAHGSRPDNQSGVDQHE